MCVDGGKRTVLLASVATLTGAKPHFILMLDFMIWLWDALWCKWSQCMCQQQSPPMMEVHHSAKFILVGLFSLPVQRFDMCPSGCWFSHVEASSDLCKKANVTLSSHIYSSLMIITAFSRAGSDGSKSTSKHTLYTLPVYEILAKRFHTCPNVQNTEDK